MTNKKQSLRIALLDMNDGYKNQGMRCIREIVADSVEIVQQESDCEIDVVVDQFSVRDKGEVPDHQYDVYVSSGGPGSPFDGEGKRWEADYFRLLDSIIDHNNNRKRKAFFFGICHSFQMVARRFRLAEVQPAARPIYGIMPVYPTPEGMMSYLLEDLADRFFAFERRNFQVVDPDESAISEIGARVLAIESRNGAKGKAVMTISIGNEFKAVQFHPEADRDSVLKNFLDPDKRDEIMNINGEELYNKMVASLRNEDRVKRTRSVVLPKFLSRAFDHLLEKLSEAGDIESDDEDQGLGNGG